VVVYDGMDEKKLFAVAGALENGSEHPLAEAILEKCRELEVQIPEVKDFTADSGKGIRGIVDGKEYFGGNIAYIESNVAAKNIDVRQCATADEFSKVGKTPLYFADKNGIIGIVAVADTIKETSKEAVEQFKKLGIKVIMLTGDNRITAQAVKEQVGTDEVIAGVLPDEKEAKISQLKTEGHVVAMIGDGVNDAPALASADVGIAIGAGTDVAIESADIVLMKNDLTDGVGAVRLSRSVIRNIRQNLFWAFFYNSIGIPLAAGALYPAFGIRLNPMFGAAAMSLSSICVVLNALRLRGVKLYGRKKRDIQSAEIDSQEQKNIKTDSEGEKKFMKKKIYIEGMACMHCVKHATEALERVDGIVSVSVSLEEKKAEIEITRDISDDELKSVIEEAGYEYKYSE